MGRPIREIWNKYVIQFSELTDKKDRYKALLLIDAYLAYKGIGARGERTIAVLAVLSELKRAYETDREIFDQARKELLNELGFAPEEICMENVGSNDVLSLQ